MHLQGRLESVKKDLDSARSDLARAEERISKLSSKQDEKDRANVEKIRKLTRELGDTDRTTDNLKRKMTSLAHHDPEQKYEGLTSLQMALPKTSKCRSTDFV